MTAQVKKQRKPRPPRPRHINPPQVCKQPGCTEMSKVRKDGVSLGYCTMHFAAVSSAQWAARRAGIPVGTVRRASNGYWTEWDGHRWRYEHELIGERLLGRKLRDNETITHITGSGDNSVMNLQLCTSVPLSVAASIAGGEKPG